MRQFEGRSFKSEVLSWWIWENEAKVDMNNMSMRIQQNVAIVTTAIHHYYILPRLLTDFYCAVNSLDQPGASVCQRRPTMSWNDRNNNSLLYRVIMKLVWNFSLLYSSYTTNPFYLSLNPKKLGHNFYYDRRWGQHHMLPDFQASNQTAGLICFVILQIKIKQCPKGGRKPESHSCKNPPISVRHTVEYIIKCCIS